MRRERSVPRPEWRKRVESVGLSYHSGGDKPYWCEDFCYAFNAGQINRLENATNTLHELCMRAAERLIAGGDLDRLLIPRDFQPLIERSWRRSDPCLYGRFDLAFDGENPPKMLEYNADTPTALLEAAVAQWWWLEETRPAADQFNSIHERLIAGWKTLAADGPADGGVHFAGVLDAEEDRVTIEYLQDVCQQAGVPTCALDVADIGWNGGAFTDLDERPIRRLFKLYPWEWLLQESFAQHLQKSDVRFIEPPWKMVLSTKAILPILWEMFPDHPNLLPAAFERSSLVGACVEKPYHGREGDGIKILPPTEAATPDQGDTPRIWQAYHPPVNFDGRYAVIGSWVICGEAAGIGVRESVTPITDADSLFVPHWF